MSVFDLIARELRGVGYPEQSVRTSQIRSISAKVYRTLESKNISDVLKVSEELLEHRDWAYGVIAYDWNDCDDFCTHAFGELIRQHNELFEKVLSWVEHDHFAVQRAAAVVLIYPVNKNVYKDLKPTQVVDHLLENEHHLVQKGYGWLLKVFSKKEPELVVEYLKNNHDKMPRTAFRYALENLDKDTQQGLMSL
ncbi:DNA alkylation repair protein [Vibrio lentus]|nr:DNA alkylation repair protein [Vibrio lentus]